ncbi:unnamed protein product [Paramecium pentaurelia]|uniref:Protein kinase domain-containing protein n=1 Tax=Paramecium pentaurelia TaxID=43138 RepID=A0A8S1YI24_9CILI|nr:unnamed protein product [Paramecium pentaurelia]
MNKIKKNQSILTLQNYSTLSSYKNYFSTLINYQHLQNLQGELLEGQRYRHALLKLLQLIILDRYPQLIYIVMRNILFTEIQSQKLLLLLTKQNLQLKLINVGESKFVKNKSMNKDIGTLAFYVAPEVLNHQYDEKCDLQSCEIIFYVLLCRNTPFTGRIDHQLLEKYVIWRINLKMLNNLYENSQVLILKRDYFQKKCLMIIDYQNTILQLNQIQECQKPYTISSKQQYNQQEINTDKCHL